MHVSNEVILQARRLSKVYQTGELQIHALREVSVDLHAGELVVILGASGSGKSTLLNIMGGLDTPSSGELFYKDENLSQYSDRQLTQYRRAHVGFVFQFYNLIPSLTARENVALITDIMEEAMSPEEALELVGLQERMNHFPSQLSGGEQQRVAIARAVAKRPHILLCDEPTGALDATTGKLVLSVINKVNTETGTSTAIITHNAAIGAMGDTIIQMSSGQIMDITHNAERADLQGINW
ncbi:MAG: ABC transporter [Gammaproteobacteria bacterium]|nr:ABC transporter [Gammaproteobacteria bacterium]|tara:strand:+ start:808 stop:1524 length:717 start_codon:yes stop_codon:yes gene_type:complete